MQPDPALELAGKAAVDRIPREPPHGFELAAPKTAE